MAISLTGGITFSGGVTFTVVVPPPENTAAWFAGGAPSSRSTVDRITFATDTATASVRGPLSADSRQLAAAGGTQ
jgi:hypothetical protein